jgi:hypothetical protein
MSRFGISIGLVTLSASLAAQTASPGQTDAKSSQTAPPVPWLDPSLANASDRAKMLAISAPNPDQANSEQPAVGKSAPIKQLDAIKNKATTPVLSTENRKPKN